MRGTRNRDSRQNNNYMGGWRPKENTGHANLFDPTFQNKAKVDRNASRDKNKMNINKKLSIKNDSEDVCSENKIMNRREFERYQNLNYDTNIIDDNDDDNNSFVSNRRDNKSYRNNNDSNKSCRNNHESNKSYRTNTESNKSSWGCNQRINTEYYTNDRNNKSRMMPINKGISDSDDDKNWDVPKFDNVKPNRRCIYENKNVERVDWDLNKNGPRNNNSQVNYSRVETEKKGWACKPSQDNNNDNSSELEYNKGINSKRNTDWNKKNTSVSSSSWNSGQMRGQELNRNYKVESRREKGNTQYLTNESINSQYRYISEGEEDEDINSKITSRNTKNVTNITTSKNDLMELTKILQRLNVKCDKIEKIKEIIFEEDNDKRNIKRSNIDENLVRNNNEEYDDKLWNTNSNNNEMQNVDSRSNIDFIPSKSFTRVKNKIENRKEIPINRAAGIKTLQNRKRIIFDENNSSKSIEEHDPLNMEDNFNNYIPPISHTSSISPVKSISNKVDLKPTNDDLNTSINTPSELIYYDPSELSLQYKSSIKDMNFGDLIKHGLKLLNINDPCEVLKTSWCILQSTSCLIIDKKDSGLTTSCIVCVLNKHDKYLRGKCMSPVIVYVVNNYENAVKVNEIFKILLSGLPSVKVVSIISSLNELLVNELVRGVHIIISTLPLLIEAYSKKYLTFESIQTIVFDDAIDIVDRQMKNVNNFLKLIPPYCSRIIASHQWTNSFSDIVSNDMRIVIIDPIEIATFKKISFRVEMCYKNDKIDTLIPLINSNKAHKKIVFCVESALDVNRLCQKLYAKGYKPIQITEWQSEEEIYDINKLWNNVNSFMIIVSENVLERLKINSGTFIIHYNFPKSKSSLRNRIKLVLNSIISNITIQCIFIIDEECVLYLHHLINFFYKINGNLDFIPNDILKRSLLARDKSATQLCNSFKLFGFCYDLYSCNNSHIHTCGSNNKLPMNGKITMKMINVISCTNYYCRIISYEGMDKYDINMNFTTISTEFQFTAINLTEIPIITEKDIQQKSIYAYKDAQGIFHRVKILDVLEYDKFTPRPLRLLVFYIDVGCEMKVLIDDLRIIPNKYQCIPPLVNEIVLVGIKPRYKQNQWGCDAIRAVSQMFSVGIIEANIIHSCNNIIYVDDAYVLQSFTNIKDVIRSGVKKLLISANSASLNLKHHEIFQTITNYYTIPKCEFVINNPIQVSIGDIYTNGDLYIIINKELEHIDKVLDTITQFIPLTSYPCKYCIVKIDDKLYRAEILSRTDVNNTLYLIDHGRIVTIPVNECYNIDQNLINIPSCSVLCKLYGVDMKSDVVFHDIIQVQEMLENTNIKAIPTFCDNGKYIVKLVKIDDLDQQLCLSSFLLFKCLIKPSNEFLLQIFPHGQSDDTSWNYHLVNCLNGVTSSKLHLDRIFKQTTDTNLLCIYQCDLDFLDSFLKTVSTTTTLSTVPNNNSIYNTPPRIPGSMMRNISPMPSGIINNASPIPSSIMNNTSLLPNNNLLSDLSAIPNNSIHSSSLHIHNNIPSDLTLIPSSIVIHNDSQLVTNSNIASESLIESSFLIPPNVRWCQNEAVIEIIITFESIENLVVNFNTQNLYLSFTSSQIQYGFNEKLYDEIIPSKCTYSDINLSNKLIVKLIKHHNCEWDRLFFSTNKYLWLTYDFNRTLFFDNINNLWDGLTNITTDYPNYQQIVPPHDAPGWSPNRERSLSLPSDAYSDIEVNSN